MKQEKALVVFSGGQDSSTCLFWAKSKFGHVEAVAFHYGQRHLRELQAAREISGIAGVPFQVLELPLLKKLTANSLTRSEWAIEKQLDNSPPNTLVEGRNLLFLTYAAIYAKGAGINNLVMGVSQTDYSGYPDCRDIFIKSANATINLAMDYEFLIHAPLMHLTKCETWELADELGFFEVIKQKTVTCYEGIPGEGCGKCPSCELRERGLKEFILLKTKRL